MDGVLNPKLVHTFTHDSVVCCVRFSSDGKYVATGCNRTAQIYNAETGQKVCILVDERVGQTIDLYIRSVCFSTGGKYLATGAEDGRINVWDIAKRRIRSIYDGHQKEVYSIAFSKDENFIVSGSEDGTARIWAMSDWTSKKLVHNSDSFGDNAGVSSVAISPNDKFVATAGVDATVSIWDVATAQLVGRLRGHQDSVYSVRFMPDGKGLVSGSLDKTIKYWDVSGLISVPVPSGPDEHNALLPPGGQEDNIQVDRCTMTFTGHEDFVLSVAVSHDGRWVVSGSKDKSFRFWDSRAAVAQCQLQEHENSVISVDLSPVSNMLATGSGDFSTKIWSYESV